MTAKIFRRLPAGTKVRWRERANSPRAGEVTETGIVIIQGDRHFVEWFDGQQTEAFDDWALLQVEVETQVKAGKEARNVQA